MNLQDNIDLTGTLSIYLDYGEGKELFFKKQNLITNVARMALLRSLTLSGVSDPIITLHAGTGGTSDTKGLYPYVENPLATGLAHEVIGVPVSTLEDTNAITITFLADILTTQANGLLITEAGLFKTSGAMFNLKNHPGIFKSAAFSIHYEWVIAT